MGPDPVYSAEAMLCAALLEAPAEYENVRWLDPDTFTNHDNRSIYIALRWVYDHQHDIPGDEVPARVRHLLTEYKQTSPLARLVTITGAYPVIAALAVNYAHAIYEAYQHEVLKDAVAAMAKEVARDVPLEVKANRIDELWTRVLGDVTAQAGWQPIGGLYSVPEFINTDADHTHQWVIPGMLERQERFMLIAPVKAGKTVLTRQVALSLAAGRHPFNQATEVPPMRTLLVDLENPAGSARRDLRRQVDRMEGLWQTTNPNAFILHRPAGIHLGDHVDRMMLRQAVERLRIDLLCLSPIYKAFDGLDKSWEEQAFGVQKPLDRLREDYNLAIWLEHHSPHAEKGAVTVRPFGSSRWGRWLDYQAALVPTGPAPYATLRWDSVRRDEAKMAPESIRRGIGDEASWVPVWRDGDYGFDLALHESEV